MSRRRKMPPGPYPVEVSGKDRATGETAEPTPPETSTAGLGEQPDEPKPLPDADCLKALFRVWGDAKADRKRINEELSEELKAVKETRRFHIAAFKSACKILDLPADKRTAWLAAFDYYRRELKLDQQPTLPFDKAPDGSFETPPPGATKH